jgi:hypothetical protein
VRQEGSEGLLGTATKYPTSHTKPNVGSSSQFDDNTINAQPIGNQGETDGKERISDGLVLNMDNFKELYEDKLNMVFDSTVSQDEAIDKIKAKKHAG